MNSPSDDALATRDTTAGNLSFKVTSLGTFTVLNSVQAGGIHPKPDQLTGGDGPVTGQEVVFDITFLTLFEGDFTGVFGRMVPLAIGVAIGAQAGASLARWVGGVWIIRFLVVALAFVGVRLIILAWQG